MSDRSHVALITHFAHALHRHRRQCTFDHLEPEFFSSLSSLALMTVKEITFRINQLQTQYLYIIITIKLLQRADPQKSLLAHIFPK